MNFDIAIVGGGIIGVTAGRWLAERGLKVCVVERGKLASGTSGANFSWVNASQKTTDAKYHHLNALGVRLYADLGDELGYEALGLRRSGSIAVAAGTTGVTALKGQAARLTELGYPNRLLEPVELQALEPQVIFAPGTSGLLAPSDMILDAARFVGAMAARIRALGGEVVEDCPALELLSDDDGQVSGLRTSEGEIATARVLIAAGPDTPDVLAALTGFDGFAARFPVVRVPGLLVTTPPVSPGLVRHLLVRDTPDEFHVFPDFNGGLRLGSDDADARITEDSSVNEQRDAARLLLARMQALAPGFAGEACLDDCHIRIGIRAVPQDGISIAGPLPGAEGVFVIATHSGVTLAPALASLMAGVIADGVVPDMLKPFTLDRLPGFGG
ncbi:MAG: FAD-binding oxidoreductase [Rhodobacteraceae bacterium]|nr:FAD-binding oxidoreductase [Paracoccaceae bacterium]